MVTRGYGSNTYQQTQVEGVEQDYLVILLMQALIKFLNRAAYAMADEDHETKADALAKAGAVLSELVCSLDEEAEAEVAGQLRDLYAHWQAQLVNADIEDDLDTLNYVRQAVKGLADAWQEAWEKCRRDKNSQAA
jgi:flagellar biosynthetic protein FliS